MYADEEVNPYVNVYRRGGACLLRGTERGEPESCTPNNYMGGVLEPVIKMIVNTGGLAVTRLLRRPVERCVALSEDLERRPRPAPPGADGTERTENRSRFRAAGRRPS